MRTHHRHTAGFYAHSDYFTVCCDGAGEKKGLRLGALNYYSTYVTFTPNSTPDTIDNALWRFQELFLFVRVYPWQ